MKKSLVNSILFIICIISVGCKNTNKKIEANKIIIDKSDSIQFVEINDRENHKTIIAINKGRIEYISKYKNDKVNGEQLQFYGNGRLKSKVEVLNGLSNGNLYEFYPSGSIKKYTFFCKIYPCYFGVEYWDNPLNTIKQSIHYGEKGNINKIKLFDTLGYFIKDSIP